MSHDGFNNASVARLDVQVPWCDEGVERSDATFHHTVVLPVLRVSGAEKERRKVKV
jgi:hypothetical protein